MKWPWQKEDKVNQFETVLQRLIAAQEGNLTTVTPENCMRSPTMQAIVTAVSRRLAVTPIHVFQTGEDKGIQTKTRIPNHPVTKLLKKPNSFQNRYDFWQDAASSFIREGAFIALKSQGTTGPIRELIPFIVSETEFKQDDNLNVTVKYRSKDYTLDKLLYARGQSREFFNPNSPVRDISTTIALEIAAEEFGASFFNNGAVPLMIFKLMAGNQGFKTLEDQQQFITDFQAAYSGSKRHKAMILPKGVEKDTELTIDNDKAQFLQTREFVRTVIAGAYGVPPHLVGDLLRATFNNVEQQDSDFTLNVIMPIAQSCEAAMEDSLLTEKDRDSGIIIRFNLDAVLRADFKSRQEGLQIQRNNGVINPDEWREIEGKNPIEKGNGGRDYVRPANFVVAGDEDESESDDTVGDQETLEEAV